MRRALAMLVLLFIARSEAAEVRVVRHDGKLGVRVTAVAYPTTLGKELTSGLTNRLFARVTLLDTGKALDQRAIEIALRYDLWDEKFSLVRTMNEAVTDSRNLDLAEVQAMLATLSLPDLFDLSRLPDNRDLIVRVDLLLNPIDREKMRTIRKWVAQNTSPVIGGEHGSPSSNAVFNRIFEQYADSDLAAAWRATLESATFRADALKHERN